jgi:L-lactate utilization protein LutB
MSDRREADRIRHLLETDGPQIKENTRLFNAERYARIDEIGSDRHEHYRTAAREIKEDAIERLPELIERTRKSVTANGGTVYVADDAADACEYVTELASENDADSVVKSKSMTTEEIDLNEALTEREVDVWETDLGEFVVQVADEGPSHIVGPSLHRSREDITELFEAVFDPDEPLDSAEKLTDFARAYLGERVEAADIGITGANFVLAESGSIVLVTNEGNARKCASIPDVHVAVAGIEKLIPSVGELHPFAELISLSATGQSISQYLSILSPPVETPTVDFEADTVGDSECESTSSSWITGAPRCARTTTCARRCTASGVAPARIPVRISSRPAATPSAARRTPAGSPPAGRPALRG